MRISENKNIVVLKDRFEELCKFFQEYTENTRCACIYENVGAVPDRVMTSVVRSETDQLIVFIPFESDNVAGAMSEIVSMHDRTVRQGLSVRYMWPTVYETFRGLDGEQIMLNNCPLSCKVKNYLKENVERLKDVKKGDPLDGFSLVNTQIQNVDDFFRDWETFVETNKRHLQ